MPVNLVNVVTIVQVRMGSSRLPNKVVMSLAGEPLFIRMLERVRGAKLSGTIVVATTENTEDDTIAFVAKNHGYLVFRGNEQDLLDRHYKAALAFNADVVVKIPSDCPLIDPRIIDRVIGFFLENNTRYDFVSNLHPQSYPDGNDVEVMSIQTMREAWTNAKAGFEREHTTPYIWERPEKFRLGNVLWETGKDYSTTHRFTIDYEEDYVFIKSVYDSLYHKNPSFSLYDILQLLNNKPELLFINNRYNGINWYRHHLHELKTINAT